MKRLYVLPLIFLLLAGCQILNDQDRAVLRAHSVPVDVYDKMLYGDPLSLGDVIVLSQRVVPAGLIIHYMEQTDVIYVLRKADVQRLRTAGVDESVISYMLSTAPQYGPNGLGPYVGYPVPGPPYPYGPYPYGYYDGIYPGPAVYVGGYGRWGWGGWGGGRWGGGWGHGGDWGHHH
jgi:hypothetical protein